MTKKLPNVLDYDEQRALLAVFDQRYHSGRKNRLIAETMLTVGLRVSELCSLKWTDLRARECSLVVRNGKGGRDRVLYMPQSLMDRLREYRKEAPAGSYVFATRSGDRPDRSNITKMINHYARKAGIDYKRVYSHLLRHTALTDLYRATKDIRQVQTIAGHANIETTTIYVHIAPEETREALQREKYR